MDSLSVLESLQTQITVRTTELGKRIDDNGLHSFKNIVYIKPHPLLLLLETTGWWSCTSTVCSRKRNEKKTFISKRLP